MPDSPNTNGNHPTDGSTSTAAETYEESFPSSTKVYAEHGDIRVPAREIRLGGAEPPLRVYDTTGPQGFRAEDGLPRQREPWTNRRRRTGSTWCWRESRK